MGRAERVSGIGDAFPGVTAKYSPVGDLNTATGKGVSCYQRFALSATSHNAATEGLQFYLWVFSTEDAATPEADYSNVDYYGLYSDEDWLFPSTSAIGIPNLLTATTSQVTESLYGSFNNNSLILDQAVAVIVPEPSTAALFLGVITFLARLAYRSRRHLS